MPSSVRRLSRWQLGWMWTSRSSNVGCDHHAVWTGPCVWTTVPSQHILPPRRNALSVSFWRTLTVSTRRVVTARRQLRRPRPHHRRPGTSHRRPGCSQQDCCIHWLDAGAFPRGIPRATMVKTRKQQKVSWNVVQSASFCSSSR